MKRNYKLLRTVLFLVIIMASLQIGLMSSFAEANQDTSLLKEVYSVSNDVYSVTNEVYNDGQDYSQLSLATLKLNPSLWSLKQGDRFTVSVDVQDILSLYGADIKILFDPAMLAVVDTNLNQEGTQIDLNGILSGIVGKNQVLNNEIWFSISKQGDIDPIGFSGRGTIATITFDVIGKNGYTNLEIFSSKLPDDNDPPNLIPHYTQGAELQIIGTGVVEGYIQLQGLNEHHGVKVRIEGTNLYTYTDSNGYFRLDNVPSGYHTLVAEKPEWKPVFLTLGTNFTIDAGQHFFLGTYKLLTGDVSSDNKVGLEDLSKMARAYGAFNYNLNWNANADLNNNLEVDIFDLVYMSKNWNQQGYGIGSLITTLNRDTYIEKGLPYRIETYVDIDENKAVYSDLVNDNLEVFLYDFATNSTSQLTSSNGHQFSPKISGNYVAWIDYRNNYTDLYLLDLSTGNERLVDRLAHDTPDHNSNWYRYDIKGNQIVYVKQDAYGRNVYQYNIDHWTIEQLTYESVTNSPSIDGQYTVYANGSGINLIDKSLGQQKVISPAGGTYASLSSISGNNVVFFSSRDAGRPGFVYNIVTNTVEVFAYNVDQPRIAGEKIIWRDTVTNSLMEYDLNTRSSKIVVGHPTPKIDYELSSSHLVWVDNFAGPWGIYTIPLQESTSIVAFADPSLEAVIRETLSKHSGSLTTADLGSLTYLYADYRGIKSLEGLQYAKNLQSLGLWGNQITDFTPIAGLSQLYSIGLGNNQLSSIPDLSGLSKLESLGLSSNQITMIEPLKLPTSLRSLDLGGNQITTIPDLTSLSYLESLTLWGNQISDISGLSGLSALRWVDLGSNQISTLPSLTGLSSLDSMHLYNNQITDISGLSQLSTMRSLHLGNNQITVISELLGLDSLEYLYLYNNQVTDISGLGQLPNLRYIDLGSNQITSLGNLTGFNSLVELNLYDNQIIDISWLGQLPNLRHIALWNNKISDLSNLTGFTYLEGLNLSSNQVTDISGLGSLPSLRWLDITNNQLTNLANLSGFAMLDSLNVWSNQITDFSGITSLSSLRWLSAGNNPVTSWTPLTNLANLEGIDLYNSNVTDLSIFSELPNLRYLYLNNNQITSIPVLSSFGNLRELYLSNNQLVDISGLSSFTNLGHLYLRNNQITDVSPLSNLTGLNYLDLYNNPIGDLSPLYGLVNTNIYLGQEITGLELNRERLTLQIGMNYKVTAKLLPEEPKYTPIYWYSSNPDVATVNEFGDITALNVGVANIYAMTEDGRFSDYCEVNVVEQLDFSQVGQLITLLERETFIEMGLPNARQDYLALSGNKMVFADGAFDNLDIYLYDFSTGFTTQLTNNTASQFSPKIYGDNVAWIDYRNGTNDLYLYNLVTGQELKVDTLSHYQPKAEENWYNIDMWDNFVVYTKEEPNEGRSVYLYNILTGQSELLAQAKNAMRPSIEGNYVTYAESSGEGYGIYLLDLTTRDKKRISPEGYFATPSDISGDNVVFFSTQYDRNVYLYSISQGTVEVIGYNAVRPRVVGDTVIWRSSVTSDIWEYNITTRTSSLITDPDYPSQKADHSFDNVLGNRVVWLDNYFGQWGIFSKEI